MKQLQNNFTTPEQSKRLLELGVPEDSADCYYNEKDYAHPKFVPIGYSFIKYSSNAFGHRYEDYEPCWSVGRLIEIYDLFDVCTTPQYCENYAEELVWEFENLVKNNGFDFSKLEE